MVEKQKEQVKKIKFFERRGRPPYTWHPNDDKDEEVIGEADPLIVTPARNLLDSEGRAHMID